MSPVPTTHRLPWGRIIALALTLPLAGSLQAAEAATTLSYISSPQSWIGLGESVSVGVEDGFEFTLTSNANNQAYFWINNFQNSPDPWSARSWGLNLVGTIEESPSPDTHDSSMPFQGNSSSLVDFWGNGRGNNSSTGSFTILDASYADDGTVLSFAADFTQYDEGHLNRWNKGAIRYNSDVPVNLIPEPIFPDPPIDSGWDPTANSSGPNDGEMSIDDAISLPPVVILPEPIIEGPIHVDPVIEDEIITIEPPITPVPYPIDADDVSFELFEPIYWYSSGSSISIVPIDTPVFITEFTPVPTPGPLPIAGGLAGWHSARRLRRRCRDRRWLGGNA
jgi:hypothetical protein